MTNHELRSSSIQQKTSLHLCNGVRQNSLRPGFLAKSTTTDRDPLVFIWTSLIVTLLFCGNITSLCAAQQPPNIVLFLVDDLGWSDLHCYGSRFYETPYIDDLAKNGVRFTQAYAACHVCSPTRASILTGKYPARLHLTDWLPGRKDHPIHKLLAPTFEQQLPHKEITLAEALKEHGYRTAHVGKWHLGEEPFGPTSQGFDIQIPRWNKGWPKTGFHSPFGLDGLEDKPGYYLTDRLTDEAEEFIEANRDKPIFLYLSHFAVHDPIHGREDWVKHYEANLKSMESSDGAKYVLEGNPDDPSPLTRSELTEKLNQPEWSGYKVLPQRTVKIKQQQDNVEFAAMVSAMDESLGRIVAKLKSMQLDENTIIVFFSDNGGMSAANFGNPNRVVGKNQLDTAYSTSNLPLRGAKGWLYEGGIRVPMIVKLPKASVKDFDCHEPVISNDLYPTILELAGLPARPEQHCDGVSLAGLLNGTKQTLDRDALYWHFPHYSNHGMQSPGAAIRSGDYKLLEYFENETVQLFNLKDDIGEQHDLSDSEPRKVAELQQALHRWQADVGAQRMDAKANR
jgi:arylsulfatase A-like enzyme